MAQGFDCLCGTKSCKGWISGAKDMRKKELEGMYLNGHIRKLLEEKDGVNGGSTNGTKLDGTKQEEGDEMTKVFRTLVEQAKKALEAAEKALETYQTRSSTTITDKRSTRENGIGSRALSGEMGGDTTNICEGEARRGVTSREMSGEMGGDTTSV
jgi:hypothetical protein